MLRRLNLRYQRTELLVLLEIKLILYLYQEIIIVTVQLEEELNLTANNYVVIAGDVTGNAGINPYYVGEKQVSSVITKTQFTFLSASDEMI